MRPDLEAALRLSSALPSRTHRIMDDNTLSCSPRGETKPVKIGNRTFRSVASAAHTLHLAPSTVLRMIDDGRAQAV